MFPDTFSTVKLDCQIQSQVQQKVCQNLQNSSNFSEQKKKNKIPSIFKDSVKAAKLKSMSLFNDKQQQPIFIPSSSSKHLSKDSNSILITRICRICETSFKNTSNKFNLFKCSHNQLFCESCLHHYVIYKTNQFQEAVCPQEICNALINAQGQFFKKLPIKIQYKFRRIQRFYLTAKDSSIKMCPSQNCEGFIKLNTGDTMLCNSCKTEYCGKCLLVKHEQECEKYELQFLLNSFLYRQCKRCKMLIQKIEGCNHMTCRCKYQFCYVCGADWTKAHYGQHDSSGNLILNVPSEEQQRCCGWWCWNDCNWNRVGRIIEECFASVRFV